MLKQIRTMTDLAKDGFTPIGETHTEHFAAIGKFILSNSGIDSQLNAILQTLLNGDYDAGRVLVGEMRTGDLISGIRHIAATKKLEDNVAREMESLFSEISRLKSARDDLAHRACLVKDDKLAFHNAMVAKTDEGIAVNQYSITELNEFSRYAASLDRRLRLLLPSLLPRDQTVIQAFVAMAILLGLQTAALKLVENPDTSKEEKDKLKAVTLTAANATTAYSDAARKLDAKFADLKLAANKALMELANCLIERVIPADLASLEIPARLRNKHRSRRKSAQERRRQPPSSLS
jgi:hypothetical protein